MSVEQEWMIEQNMPSARRLILARHGQSEGNRQNIFTGWRDMPLTDLGRSEAKAAGERLSHFDLRIDVALTSNLSRSIESCSLMLSAMGLDKVSVVNDGALNERDYGGLTGLNKDEARTRFGAEQVQCWRRSYDIAPPNGESLRDTVARVLPFYLSSILPAVMRSQTVLVVAHGNSLRALIMALEQIDPESIANLELKTGEIRIYGFREDTSVAEAQSISD